MRIQKQLRNTDGFVSTYFLSILLYIVSVITVIILRDKANMQCMMNMKEANMYLQQEIRVISDIKQKLLEGNLEDNEMYEVDDHFIYVTITQDYPETLVLTLDEDDITILSYTSARGMYVDKYAYFTKINYGKSKGGIHMIQSTEIKPGQCFIWEGNLYQCLDKSLNKTAMAKMKVALKVKDPRTGVVKELGLIGSDRVEEASIDKREMQYLYDDGASLVFMDTETYDQIEIPEERVEWEKNFLKPSEMINIQVFDGEILGVILPDKVSLKITECEQAVKGDTATSAQKNAVVETGLQVKVPLFIQEGETIVVSTADGKYCSRAKD